jgi:hypothetical protein
MLVVPILKNFFLAATISRLDSMPEIIEQASQAEKYSKLRISQCIIDVNS